MDQKEREIKLMERLFHGGKVLKLDEVQHAFDKEGMGGWCIEALRDYGYRISTPDSLGQKWVYLYQNQYTRHTLAVEAGEAISYLIQSFSPVIPRSVIDAEVENMARWKRSWYKGAVDSCLRSLGWYETDRGFEHVGAGETTKEEREAILGEISYMCSQYDDLVPGGLNAEKMWIGLGVHDLFAKWQFMLYVELVNMYETTDAEIIFREVESGHGD
jgi:hypothetical protein